MDYLEKMQRWHKHVEALEEERRKILVFQKELPLCLELVTQAIEAGRRELSGTTTECNMLAQSECSEETSGDDYHGPVLEEFIPTKPTNTTTHIEDGQDRSLRNQTQPNINNESSTSCKDKDNGKDKDKKKSDWMRSVQLWNQSSPDPSPPTITKQEVPKKDVVIGGAFQHFQLENNNNNNEVNDSNTNNRERVASKVGNGGGGGKEKEKKDDGNRKQRRCWSRELHHRFLHAIHLLGGSHEASPKRIMQMMKVDGLTNDEVKSHLQKYRLHTRRPSYRVHNSNPQAPQFMLMGGIWVPPPEYASGAAPEQRAMAPATNMIHPPVATIAPALPSTIPRMQNSDDQNEQNLQVSEGREIHNESCQAHSNSPTSSYHTPTTSPVH